MGFESVQAEDAFRVQFRYACSTEYEIERLDRGAPMLLIGEGTVNIQKTVTGRRLLEQYGSPEAGRLVWVASRGRFRPSRGRS